MSQLGEMSPGARGLLIGLLYRVGVWISHTDDEGGESDDSRETKALEHIIRSVARVHEESAFVQEVAQETLKRRGKWELWAKHSFDILADCGKAAALLKAQVNSADRRDFCQTLLNIAEAVAAAHGEFGAGGGDDENALGLFLGRVVSRFKGETQEVDFINISPAEEDALQRLRVALKMDDES